MSKRDIGQEILDGIRDVKAYKAGKKSLHIHSFRKRSPRKVIRAKQNYRNLHLLAPFEFAFEMECRTTFHLLAFLL